VDDRIKSRADDYIALIGLICFLIGLYLWLGLPAALMVLGIVMVYAGVKLDPAELWRTDEPDQTAAS
jgi:hypothetical protein